VKRPRQRMSNRKSLTSKRCCIRVTIRDEINERLVAAGLHGQPDPWLAGKIVAMTAAARAGMPNGLTILRA